MLFFTYYIRLTTRIIVNDVENNDPWWFIRCIYLSTVHLLHILLIFGKCVFSIIWHDNNKHFHFKGSTILYEHIYGWNSPERISLLDECRQNVRTLGLLTWSVLIKITCFLPLVRNCHWDDDIKKYQLERVPKKSKFSVKNWL